MLVSISLGVGAVRKCLWVGWIDPPVACVTWRRGLLDVLLFTFMTFHGMKKKMKYRMSRGDAVIWLCVWWTRGCMMECIVIPRLLNRFSDESWHGKKRFIGSFDGPGCQVNVLCCLRVDILRPDYDWLQKRTKRNVLSICKTGHT